MVFESDTIGSESIEVWRLDMRVAQGRQAIASPLVRSYEEYVHRCAISQDFESSQLSEWCINLSGVVANIGSKSTDTETPDP